MTSNQPPDDSPPISAHAPLWDEATEKGAHLVVVGGAEDRVRQKVILRHFVELCGGTQAKLLIVAVASETPEAIYEAYKHAFGKLGVADVRGLLATTREELGQIDSGALLDGVTGIYFSGGDQLRISTILGGTSFFNLMAQRIRAGCTLGGTSAGASVLSDTMIIDWEPSDQPLAHNIRLSSGLGIMRHLIIDQHFSQRNRLNRLITSVSYHPGYLGIGVDEDTAAVICPGGVITVIGSGTVTIVDGSEISDCNIAETPTGQPFSVVGLKVHVLTAENSFNLKQRRPVLTSG